MRDSEKSKQSWKLITKLENSYFPISNIKDSRKNSYVAAFNLKVTIFGQRACKELTKVKWGYHRGALIQQGWCPYKKRKRHEFSPPCKDTMRRQSISQKERSCQELNQLTRWSGNSSQHCENIKFCCLSQKKKKPSYFEVCALENNHCFYNICVFLKMISDLMWYILVI